MKISLRWLGRHVDLSGITPEQIAEDLTLSTAEIEAVHPWGRELAAVVVGEVVACAPHPDADHLHLCQVADGGPEPRPVVCGAANVARGQKVAFARAGTTLPGGTTLKATRIRGAQSTGMILSEQEMGLAEESAGILVLDPGAPVGRPLPELLPVTDAVLEIDNKSITHRPDLWGHYGFARELAALYGRALAPIGGGPSLPAAGAVVPIHLADRRLCPRYVGLVLEGVRVGPSPEWLRWLLMAVGQRPLGNLVDLTNFLLLDLGQPMHAFDLDRLEGPAIQVRRAAQGERIVTLDGVERALTPADLVIADQARPVALAGIMGGAGSEIGPGTTRLFLESACFDAVTIRRTSARLALRTEASARFEKSLDPAQAMAATLRFAGLLGEVCPGARAAGPAVDAGEWRFPGRTVGLRRERVALKLGVEIPEERIERILASLHFDPRPAAWGWEVGVPSFRATKDVALEDDLIEEVGRIHRYGNIPPRPMLAPVEPPWRDPELDLERRLRAVLAWELRLREAYDYSFLPEELAARLGLEGGDYLRLRNPIAENLVRVRRHVLPGLLGSLELNLRHRDEVALFELGKGYHPEVRDERNQPREVREAAGLLARRRGEGLLPEVKGFLEHLAARLDLPEPAFARAAPGSVPGYLHPVLALEFRLAGNLVGFAAEVHPRTLERLGAPGAAAAFSLDLRAVLAAGRRERRFRPLPVFPPILVDVAVLGPEELLAGEVAAALARAGKSLVHQVELFDVFRGPSLGAGRRSLAFHVTLLSPERTLGDEDEKRFLDRVRKVLPELGASLRG